MGYSKLTYEDWIDSPGVFGRDLPQWASELSEYGYDGVSAIDFYDDIFGDDLEEERMPEDYRQGEYAGIAIERVPKIDDFGNPALDKYGKQLFRGRRRMIMKGNAALYDLIDHSENFCMIAPISYAGRSRVNKNARYMYALCIEIDHIKNNGGLNELIYSWERKYKPIPKPTYIVCSGNGLHLYYVFERPIPLWKNIFESITEAKKNLTQRIWTSYVTDAYEKIEYESINQPFRCVGGRTKGDSYAMAFQCGEKVTIEYLNKFLPENAKMDCIYKTKHSIQEAKELYPDWYQRRIENGEDRGHWNRYKPIYFNWIDKILDGAEVGKRYHCLENLCSLAVQCNIEPEQVEKDCRMVAEQFEKLTVKEDNHFTEYDVICAMKTYQEGSEQAYRRRIEFISKKTGITLEANKRNGRKQVDHLWSEYWYEPDGQPKVNLCKGNRELALKHLRKNGGINGRPSKEQTVREWRESHPDGKKADCIRDTGLDKKTVYKWWEPGVAEKHTKKYKIPELEQTASMVQEEKVPYGIKKRKTLPDAFVVEGDPNMMQQMMAYAAAGIRSVEILTEKEYAELLTEGYGDWLLKDKKET